MQKILINVTDELREVLDALATESGEALGELVERLLRTHKDIKKIRTEWPERTKRGKPRAVPKKVHKAGG